MGAGDSADRIEQSRDSLEQLLARALQLDASGDLAAARSAYLQLLQRDPTHFTALNELGGLAQDSGHVAAARTAYEQAVRHHPGNPIGRVNLGHLLYEAGEFVAARVEYEAALAAAPGHADAHQGLARVFGQLGQYELADEHRRKGFGMRPLITRRYRGTAPPISVLMLVSTQGGNIPTRHILDNRTFALTALYPQFYDPQRPLPPHELLFNAIGDADLCDAELAQAQALAARTSAPVVNQPHRVRLTGRVANCERLARLPGLIVPGISIVKRSALLSGALPEAERLQLPYPLLLRAPGFHTGRHFVRVEGPADLLAAAAALPGETLLAIEYLDARGADGMARKYRVMYIDGALYPLHLAISADWKVHYFSSAMADNAAYRAEEQRFLANMAEVLGQDAMRTLAGISERLGLDYAGVDFAVDHDGTLLLFEANATMVINPVDPDPKWEYRRIAITRALDAARQMLINRSAAHERPR